MNRRDALRLLAAGAALPLVPENLLARALRDARAVVDTATGPRTLSAHQFETVAALAETIIPKTDTPGAADVGTAQFIDLMMTEWYDDAERSRFLKGVDDVNARTQALFGKEFVGCLPEQQSEIMAWLGEQIAEALERQREHPTDIYGSEKKHPESFYSMLRRLTLTAYYTSEEGATAELHYEIIPDHYDGCAEVRSEKEGSGPQ